MRVRLTEASAPPAAVQVLVDYTGSDAEVIGNGANVMCASEVSEFVAFEDSDAARTIRVAAIDLPADLVPGILGTCRIRMYSDAQPTNDTIQLTIEDASDAGFEPVDVDARLVFLEAGILKECGDRCGDGILDNQYEGCDDGNNSDADFCPADCRPPPCGDGVVDEGEECDDGNWIDNDGCRRSCKLAKCGDTVVWLGQEHCDDGNTLDGDFCPGDCTRGVCGDGITEVPREQCDDANTVNDDSCTVYCRFPACGDGFLQGSEQCDDGNNYGGDACPRTCIPAHCGDGWVWNGYEQCDDGNSTEGDGCSSTCKPRSCGDGFLDQLEQCDDGNLDNHDACLASCLESFCGDGVHRPALEACDDANTSDEDRCTTGCLRAICGDGHVLADIEACDDGNVVDDETCPSDCAVLPSCGDAVVDGWILSSDALRVLQLAVGNDVECAQWVCDVDSTGEVNVTDSLRLLRRAVEQPVVLNCQPPSRLRLRLVAAGNVATLAFDVDHSGAAATLVGEGTAVACEPLVEGATFTFDDSAEGILHVAASHPDGFGDRKSIASCTLLPSGSLRPHDFPVTILQADGPEGSPVSGVAVRAVPY